MKIRVCKLLVRVLCLMATFKGLLTLKHVEEQVSGCLFNDISTFVGYLMPKLFSEKNRSGTI